MPTGYTADIEKDITFKEFALHCARAFGVNVLMKDDPPHAPIKEYFASEYHLKELERCKKQLELVRKFTKKEIEQENENEYNEKIKRLKGIRNERIKLKAKYEKMRKNVLNWKPPTNDHECLKKFMLEQIDMSIDHDCDDPFKYEDTRMLSPQEWYDNTCKKLINDIDYHEKEYTKEIISINFANTWNKKLIESLDKYGA